MNRSILVSAGVSAAIILFQTPAAAQGGTPPRLHVSDRWHECSFQIDPSLFQPQPHYLLKVTGMSMKNAGILDGDLVAVHRTPEVRNRQIIVARLENEVTVKRYKQDGSVVWLMPENADFDHPGSVLYFRVNDIDQTHATLKERGVNFVDAPHLIARMPDHELWMTFFKDSEGNTLALMAEKR